MHDGEEGNGWKMLRTESEAAWVSLEMNICC